MSYFYPLRFHSSLHETIWGGRRLEQEHWKTFAAGETSIGESWETETSNRILNGPYEGMTLGALVEDLGPAFLGQQATAIFGMRFPLLAKFIDANAQLSVQVHPRDEYAHTYENGKLGKTEFWYILAADPDAKIVYGFQKQTDADQVRAAINSVTLDTLLHEEPVAAGDVVFVPAGTVHAIGSGILLYELQEYSDVTYRMYDYGRLSANGKPRELHIERSLDVAAYTAPQQVKIQPVVLTETAAYRDRCLVACNYFVSHEITLKEQDNGVINGTTKESCVIISSLGANAQIAYGEQLDHLETLSKGETLVLPAALGAYRITGTGQLLFSYVPAPEDPALAAWRKQNPLYA